MTGGTSTNTGISYDIMMRQNHDRSMFEPKSLVLFAPIAKRKLPTPLGGLGLQCHGGRGSWVK